MISVHQTIKGDPRLVSNLLLKEARLTLCFFDWLGKFVHNNKQFDLRASSKYCQTFFQGTVRCSSGGKVQSCFAFYLELTKDEKQTNAGNFPRKEFSHHFTETLPTCQSCLGNDNFCGKEIKHQFQTLLKDDNECWNCCSQVLKCQTLNECLNVHKSLGLLFSKFLHHCLWLCISLCHCLFISY